ncbi:unnamed protein product [Trifolium pratense]|uniref:Uncharacterized protein n=1 Tax=Trifolium pratense TaxID=57577 RepID=A0ACB0LEM8_TRIPR|nr:unnamed protein product [Trifolium pratense]
MLVDREGMWFRVLAARYGVDRERLRDGGRHGSVWWRDIASIREGGGVAGGSGIMLSGGWGTILILFYGLILGWIGLLCAQSSDRWQWRLEPDTGYIVRGAYKLLTTMDEVEHLIWHPQVPLKVSVFAWRLLRDRLPTKSNLVTRGILSSAAHFCVSGCREVETAQHLFISYDTFGSLWDLVCTWIDISPSGSTSIQDHFVQFTSSAGGTRARQSFLQLIWLACV